MLNLLDPPPPHPLMHPSSQFDNIFHNQEFWYFTFQKFHQRISACVLDREIFVQYKTHYLSSWLKYPLNNRQSIYRGYLDFFDERISKPKYVRAEAKRLKRVIRQAGMTIPEYLAAQSDSYIEFSNFIHNYEIYCSKNLNREQCETLIRMAPTTNTKIKSVLEYMQKKIWFNSHIFNPMDTRENT